MMKTRTEKTDPISKREAILLAGRLRVQAHGYAGLNFRELADEVGIKAASVYHHFSSKAELGEAVARRYWEDAKANLDALTETESEPLERLRKYPQAFRRSLESDNRLCMGSFMSAEHDDLPEGVMREVLSFSHVNVAWLNKTLLAAGVVSSKKSHERALAIFAAIAGAQLIARSRADISVFDSLIDSYRTANLLPK